MPEVYGGTTVENIAGQDEDWQRQLGLFEQSFINGIQVLVPHPTITPTATAMALDKLIGHVPEKMGVFIHLASEQ